MLVSVFHESCRALRAFDVTLIITYVYASR